MAVEHLKNTAKKQNVVPSMCVPNQPRQGCSTAYARGITFVCDIFNPTMLHNTIHSMPPVRHPVSFERRTQKKDNIVIIRKQSLAIRK